MIPKILAHSSQGRPVEYFHFGSPSFEIPWILFLGGVHGDEPEGVWLMEEVRDALSKREFSWDNLGVGLIPQLNPDGCAQSHRLNGRQVDLNRNLPTRDWTSEIKNPKYPPGPSAGSEAENQALVKLISEKKPLAILSAHSFHRYQININGPSRAWGETIQPLCGYPITEDIGYPTPGCLGTFSGFEREIPTITLEIERGLSQEEVIKLHKPLIFESIRFWSERGNAK
jgi:protein MpaA